MAPKGRQHTLEVGPHPLPAGEGEGVRQFALHPGCLSAPSVYRQEGESARVQSQQGPSPETFTARFIT